MQSPGRKASAGRAQAYPAMRGVMALGALLFTSVVGCRVTTALAGVRLGLSPAVIGAIIAAFSLMPLLFSVRGGQLIDRIGVRLPMAGGALLSALGMAVCAALPHPGVLAAAACVIGLGNMAFNLGMQHAAGELGGASHRTANFNLMTMSFSVSGMCGPPIAGFVIDQAGHRAAFALLSMLAVLVALGCYRFPFERHLPAGGHSASIASGGPQAPAALASALELLGERRLRELLFASLLIAAAWDAFQFLIPLHGHAIHLSAASVGLVIASFSSGSLMVRLMLPMLLGRLAAAQWVTLAMTVCALGFAVLPFSGVLPVAMAMSFVLGMGPGIGQPLLMSALHTASPEGRAGAAAGLRMTLLALMQIVLPLVLGLIGTFIGISPLFWLYSAVAVAVILMLRRSAQA